MGSFPAVEKVIWDVFTSKINNQFQKTFLQRIAGNVPFVFPFGFPVPRLLVQVFSQRCTSEHKDTKSVW